LYRRTLTALLGHRPSTAHIQQPLEAMPVPPDWILDGQPIARAITLTQSVDKRFRSGVWECTAGTFEWHFGVDEIVHILHGEVFIDCGEGRRLHLKPGDVAHFPAGTSTRWHVPEHVRKFFTHREPHGVERVLRAL
jgi:uncharacterized cupin superfamily protein